MIPIPFEDIRFFGASAGYRFSELLLLWSKQAYTYKQMFHIIFKRFI